MPPVRLYSTPCTISGTGVTKQFTRNSTLNVFTEKNIPIFKKSFLFIEVSNEESKRFQKEEDDAKEQETDSNLPDSIFYFSQGSFLQDSPQLFHR